MYLWALQKISRKSTHPSRLQPWPCFAHYHDKAGPHSSSSGPTECDWNEKTTPTGAPSAHHLQDCLDDERTETTPTGAPSAHYLQDFLDDERAETTPRLEMEMHTLVDGYNVRTRNGDARFLAIRAVSRYLYNELVLRGSIYNS